MGLSPTENKVYFGQLLGMCDQISFPLGMLTLCTAAITDSYITTSCDSSYMRQVLNIHTAADLSCSVKSI